MHFTLALLVLAAFTFVAALFIYHGHVKAALTQDAAAAALDVSTEGHKLEAGVVADIHFAEAAGKVAEGTVQKVVDAHVAQVEAVTEKIKADL